MIKSWTFFWSGGADNTRWKKVQSDPMLIFLNRNRSLRSICVTALLGRAGLTCDLFSTILDRLRIQATDENGRKTLSETSQNSESVDESSCTPRNQVIIQLSQQVTTLDVENQELKQEP